MWTMPTFFVRVSDDSTKIPLYGNQYDTYCFSPTEKHFAFILSKLMLAVFLGFFQIQIFSLVIFYRLFPWELKIMAVDFQFFLYFHF